jgi:hypothetical protein
MIHRITTILFNNSKIANTLKLLLLSVIGIIIAFPDYSFTYGTGIDPPLIWVYNYIFDTDMKLGQHILFPHGPLAFIMYPSFQNAKIGVLVKVILQIILVFNLNQIINKGNKQRILLLFFVSILLFKILPVLHIILAIILTGYLNYFSSRQVWYKYSGIILTVFALYVKAYAGILASMITFTFLIYEFIISKNWKDTIRTLFFGIAVFFLLWLALFHNFEGVFKFLIGMFNLAQDNSAAAAYYPINNWILLAGFLIIMVALPLINYDRKSKIFLTLFLLSFFGAWKHGIAREDYYHMKGLLLFSLVMMIIFLLYKERNYLLNITLLVIAISFFHLNMESLWGNKPMTYELLGSKYFSNFVFKCPSVISSAKAKTSKNINQWVLPKEIRDSIDNSKVDVYPWDYSVIAANKFVWQPRPVIQSYAAYTSWLDKQNAKHFNSTEAPEYILWHNTPNKFNLRKLNSIDNRYLLNDEPKTILEFITNYKFVRSYKDLFIYRKRDKKVELKSEKSNIRQYSWNEWIEVPVRSNEILRANINIDGKPMRSIKSFVYKDEAFFVYYKRENGDIVRSKIVPKNISDGLWINPFINDPYSDAKEHRVQKIMLSCSHQNLLKKKFSLVWETYTTIDNSDAEKLINGFFNKSGENSVSEVCLLKSTNTFEKTEPYWNNKPELNSSEYFYNGRNSMCVKPQQFSSSIKIPLDSIDGDKLRIKTSAFFRKMKKEKAKLVISIEDKTGTIVWESRNIADYYLNKCDWDYIDNEITFNKHDKSNTTLMVYFWNTGKTDLWIDDFMVEIYSISN